MKENNANLNSLRVDLHIHSCLSPCADLLMSPKRIVQQATAKNLDIIAICDHNSAENVRATVAAASGAPLTVLPGMEITSSEEAHLLAIFPGVEAALNLQKIIYLNLAPGENNEALFGAQIVANEFDEVEGFNKRLLFGATSLSMERLTNVIHELGGLAVASHVDRDVYSIMGQLGFIPDNLKLDALEISRRMSRSRALELFPEIINFPLITSSDAHFPAAIGTCFSTISIDSSGRGGAPDGTNDRPGTPGIYDRDEETGLSPETAFEVLRMAFNNQGSITLPGDK